ncbi:TLC domain-containing protein [Rhizoctonia solani AG-1 IA]|uniref:TLC domain-containing protein n=2 Tax=Rhizoctonia solani TaxID=456999 RepID=L8X7C3_THACA|nr:TLC domain-containing protein [Rhizoctonia solani AG-1 IA]
MSVLDEIGAILGRQLNLPHLPAHFQTIAYSFGAFSITYIVSALASPVIAPRTYPKLPRRTKHSWNVHAVSMAHAMVIGPMAAHRLWTLPEAESFEKAFGWNESMGLLHGIAVGLVIIRGPDVFLGLACTLIFGLSYVGHSTGIPIGSKLIWVLSGHSWLSTARPLSSGKFQPRSSIFMYLDKLQMTGGLVQAINGFILLGLFFIVRVCYGLYMVYLFPDPWSSLLMSFPQSFEFFQTLLAVHGSIPIGLTLTYGFGNIALNVLNLFWYDPTHRSAVAHSHLRTFRFTKMIAALKKRFQKGNPGVNLPNGNARANKKVRNE